MLFNFFGRKQNKKQNNKENKMKNESVYYNEMIQDGIKEIALKDTIDEKYRVAKILITSSPILKTGDALLQFDIDDENWSNEKNYLKKYMQYRIKNDNVYKGVDCDVSLLSIVMYTLLNNDLNPKDIKYQYNSGLKYEIKNQNIRYKGDTLTSALTILKIYLGSLWKYIGSNESLLKEKRFNDFYKLYNKISTKGILVAPTGKWDQYCYDNSDIIWNAMDEEAKLFFENYTMFGNYMCIPGNSYKTGNSWESFNTARSNIGRWDTVDTLLGKIYAFYLNSDETFLSSIFTRKQNELTKETLKWLENFDGWQGFVEKNVLGSFVDEETMIPISMKTGKPIELEGIKNYNPLPDKYEEFLIFFTEVAERIAIRSEYIYNKIHIDEENE